MSDYDPPAATPPPCDPRLTRPRFDLEEAQLASDAWGFNCGPAAIALVAGLWIAKAESWAAIGNSIEQSILLELVAAMRARGKS